MGDQAGDDPRSRLARAIGARRKQLGLSQPQAAKLAGVARNTWASAEDGARTIRSHNYRGIEKSLQWGTGSVEAILDGGDPTELEPSEPDRPSVVDDPLIADILATDLPDDEKAKLIHMVLKDRRRSEELRRERIREQIETYRRWQKGA